MLLSPFKYLPLPSASSVSRTALLVRIAFGNFANRSSRLYYCYKKTTPLGVPYKGFLGNIKD